MHARFWVLCVFHSKTVLICFGVQFLLKYTYLLWKAGDKTLHKNVRFSERYSLKTYFGLKISEITRFTRYSSFIHCCALSASRFTYKSTESVFQALALGIAVVIEVHAWLNKTVILLRKSQHQHYTVRTAMEEGHCVASIPFILFVIDARAHVLVRQVRRLASASHRQDLECSIPSLTDQRRQSRPCSDVLTATQCSK